MANHETAFQARLGWILQQPGGFELIHGIGRIPDPPPPFSPICQCGHERAGHLGVRGMYFGCLGFCSCHLFRAAARSTPMPEPGALG